MLASRSQQAAELQQRSEQLLISNKRINEFEINKLACFS